MCSFVWNELTVCGPDPLLTKVQPAVELDGGKIDDNPTIGVRAPRQSVGAQRQLAVKGRRPDRLVRLQIPQRAHPMVGIRETSQQRT